MSSDGGASSAEEEMALQAARARLLKAAPAKVEVGRYTLIERVGRGASANVWRAHDPKLDRDVALKLVERWGDQGVAPAEARARVVREARAVASLNHPNIVPIYDVGSFQTPGGEEGVYLAMELLEGQSLRAWMRECSREATAVLGVFDQAARALHAAHVAGVVHRDFKPANAMLDARGVVRVIDFGLARRVGAELSQGDHREPRMVAADTSLTATGSVMGTPAFMAPEQHEGGEVGPKSDQFAFCVALFEGLAGCRPFRGDNLVELAAAKQRHAVDPDALRRIPAPLRTSILRGLSPSPDDRWPDLETLRLALQSPSRRPWLLAIGLATVGAVAATAWAMTRPPPKPESLYGSAAAALRVALVERTTQVAMREVRAVRSLALDGEMAEAEARATAFVQADDPLLRPVTAAMLVERGALVRIRGGWTAAANDFERAFHLAVEAGAHDAELDAAAELCRNAYERAPQDAAQWLGQAEVALARGAGGELREAKLAAMKAEARVRASDLEGADALLTAALGRLPPKDRTTIELRLALLADRALVTRRRGLMDESNGLLQAALAEARATLGPSHPRTLLAQIAWAEIEAYVGDAEAARARARDAVNTARDGLGPSHVVVGDAHVALAQARLQSGDADGALTSFDAAQEVFERLDAAADRDLKLAETWTARGLTLDALERRSEALSTFRRARDAQIRVLGASHVYTAIIGNNISMVLRGMGRYDEAEVEAKSVAKSFGDEAHADPSVRSFTYVELSKSALAQDRHKDAHAWALEAAALWTDVEDPWNEAAGAYFLAAEAAAAFDHAEATRLARRALEGLDPGSESADTVQSWLQEHVAREGVSAARRASD